MFLLFYYILFVGYNFSKIAKLIERHLFWLEQIQIVRKIEHALWESGKICSSNIFDSVINKICKHFDAKNIHEKYNVES